MPDTLASVDVPSAVDHPQVGLLRAVTDEERDGFARDGAYVLPGVIAPEWVEFMRAAVARLMARPDPSSLDYAKGEGPKFFTQTWSWLLDDGMKALVLHGPARDIAAAVLAPTTRLNLLMDQVFVKEAGTSAGTPYHQDEPYGNISGEGNLRIWMPLDEVTRESGAVHYLKGSHRWGKLFSPVRFMNPDAPEADSPYESAPDFAADYDRYDWLVGACSPGDAILHHARTVHGGPGNSSPTPRRAVTVNYLSDLVTYQPRTTTGSRHRDIASHVTFPTLAAGDPVEGDLYPRVWP